MKITAEVIIGGEVFELDKDSKRFVIVPEFSIFFKAPKIVENATFMMFVSTRK